MKRYTKYKNSGIEWIGEIPENWIVGGMTKYIESIIDYRGRTPEKTDDGVFLVTARNIKVGKIDCSLSKEYISEDEYKRIIMTRGLPRKGDVLFTTEAPLGEVANVEEENIALAQRIIKFRGKHNYLDNYYLKYWIFSGSFQNDLQRYATGSTVLGIKASKLNYLRIVLPPLPEQKQIADFLDTKTKQIDTLIEKKQKLIELLKEQRKATINQAVTKGLDPNVPMKDSEIEWLGEIPANWSMISLKHLVSTKITDGPHETPEFVDEGIPFLSVESVQDNKLDFKRKRGFITEEIHKEYSRKCKPQRDDVFLVKSGSTTGKSTIVETDEEFNIWSPLCIIRSDKSKVIPRFTFTSVQSDYFRKFVEIEWSFGTQPNIGMGVIENIRITVPSISEQIQIVEYLDEQIQKIDMTIEKESQQIEFFKEYRTTLISEVVTGKIDVRNEV